MAAYVIFNLTEITDPDRWDAYRSGVGAAMAKFGARVISADPEFKVLEGDWPGIQNVIIEFDDMAAVERWYASDDYKPMLEMRLGSARGNLIAVHGV
jgi:uncharacterized protein (DUF1330 family)